MVTTTNELADGLQVASDYVAAMFDDLPPGALPVGCSVSGDPQNARWQDWGAKPVHPGRPFPGRPGCNLYVSGSTFVLGPDGRWRRRIEYFDAMVIVIIDDVGSKVDPAIGDVAKPTARIESSPGNYQFHYRLVVPCRERWRADDFHRAFIADHAGGVDPGQAGVTRVGRVPGGWNLKARDSGPFQVRLHDFDPSRRYTLDQLSGAFGLSLLIRPPTASDTLRSLIHLPDAEIDERVQDFREWHAQLVERRIVKGDGRPNRLGWIEARCPWQDEHTGGKFGGSAIGIPRPENAFFGSYKCHHGHCAGRGWGALTGWLVQRYVEEQ